MQITAGEGSPRTEEEEAHCLSSDFHFFLLLLLCSAAAFSDALDLSTSVLLCRLDRHTDTTVGNLKLGVGIRP